ncbi:fasciclin-1-like [Sitophilus oryzae]|uniref:Fasciclin-1-like n=1 Tax=Sitophilus oryzae TaxID=7048 RepID=A0A6J2XNF4_SITOR|nr:fasciclin-1-like [Sitophilus oryzae]
MERIKQLSKANETVQNLGPGNNIVHQPGNVELPTLRGSLKLYVEERADNSLKRSSGSAYIIHWNEQKIPVFRANVECVNGIIHVIDAPFLKKDDIRVSLGSSLKPTAVFVLIAAVVSSKYILH